MTSKIEKLEALLEGHINGPILDQTISRLTAPGENYGSLMLKVDIKVKNGDKENTLHTVAKCVPPNKEMKVIFNIDITFKNEVAWYTTIIPTLLEFQKEQGVKNAADFFMGIYGARYSLDPNTEEIDDDAVILCENLIVKGYGNADRLVGFNLEQSKEILKKLAAFHALSLALRLKKPEVFEQKVRKYLHTLQTEESKEKALEPIIQLLKDQAEISHLMPRIQKASKQFNVPTTDLREPWASAVHTDFWVNNIMLKEEEGNVPKVIILDLQTCGYGPPVDDLLFFLGTSVQTSVAERHFDELIELYYTNLIENLEILKVDTTLFSHESFQKELELQGPTQFAHSLFFVAIIFMEKGTGLDATSADFNPEQEMKRMMSNFTDRHKKKYVFLAKEFAKRNWI